MPHGHLIIHRDGLRNDVVAEALLLDKLNHR